MLNAGEGTFCNAGVWVMLQLSPTLSLGDWANAIVLPLRVYPFLSPSLPASIPPSLAPLVLSICHRPLYLHSTSSFHLRQTKCSIAFPSVVMKWEGEDKEGVTRDSERERGKERERRGGGVIVTDNSALKQQHRRHTFSR